MAQALTIDTAPWTTLTWAAYYMESLRCIPLTYLLDRVRAHHVKYMPHIQRIQRIKHTCIAYSACTAYETYSTSSVHSRFENRGPRNEKNVQQSVTCHNAALGQISHLFLVTLYFRILTALEVPKSLRYNTRIVFAASLWYLHVGCVYFTELTLPQAALCSISIRRHDGKSCVL